MACQLDTTASSSSSSSEVQRLLRKNQGEGITVLSLSERLFLMRHSSLGRELAPPSLGDGGAAGGARELDRQLGLAEGRLEQERTVRRTSAPG